MLDQPGTYDPLPYFWTEQFDTMVQQIGVFDYPDQTVMRGDPRSGRFSVFHFRQGSLSGCIAVNSFQDLAAARRLLGARVAVTAELLSDPSVDLREWSRSVAAAAQDART
jgi:hypothetical protein